MMYLSIPTGKHVFIHYDGAIREAIYLNTIITTTGYLELTFKIAGIDGDVKGSLNTFNNLYYSQADAEECKNAIMYEEVDINHYNKFAENFFLSNDCTPTSWIWCDTHPEKRRICSKYDAIFVLADNKLIIVDNKTGKQLNCEEWYKTAEECRANHRAKVVTF